jgi:DNA-binding MarR family transcriptional regulator
LQKATTSHPATQDVEDLVSALYRLGIVHRAIARHTLAELGSQGFTALAVVTKHGPVRVSDVAERLRIDLSVASRQLAALAAAGYVDRRPDPDDRRAQLVEATDDGRRVVRESHRRLVDAFASALQDWAPAEVAALAAALERLRHDVSTQEQR